MNMQNHQNLISPQAADKLLSLRDGDAALLYLYLCRHGTKDREKISRDLFMPMKALGNAFERLEMLGLLSDSESTPSHLPASDPALPPASVGIIGDNGDLPEYTAKDVQNLAENDNAFSALISEAKLIMGRALSTPDLLKLTAIYNHLELAPEVMMELMNFVADTYRDRYGESRRPTVRAFEKEAILWAERGITDFDAAEQYIRRYRERRSMAGAIKEAMKIENRDFTDTERRYVEQWLEWGFGPDAIALAYDKTVTNTRKFVPAYMNKILETWHHQGLHTIQEIQNGDRHGKPAFVVDPGTPVNPDALQGAIERL